MKYITVDQNILKDASDILVTESNQLAKILDGRGSINLGEHYHRVEIAIRSEMQRMRRISDGLLAGIPKPENEEQ